MKPNDRFLFLKNNQVSQDPTTLVQCYLPIIGRDALVTLPLYLNWGMMDKREHLFAAILNHLNLGWTGLKRLLNLISLQFGYPLSKEMTAMENLLFIQRFLARFSYSYSLSCLVEKN